jgi:hypothetical protein
MPGKVPVRTHHVCVLEATDRSQPYCLLALLVNDRRKKKQYSDNTQASMGSLDEECEVDATTDDCRDYGRFLDELKILRDTIGTPYQSSSNGKRKSLIDVIKNIKLTPPPNTKTTSSPELLAALEQAKALTAAQGVTSPAARLAWESYEEIATAGRAGNAMTVSLAEECAVEAGLEACRGMEELERVMAVLLAVSDNANKKK